MKEALKVVTAQEMARIESLAYTAGAEERLYMQQAGKAIAEYMRDYIRINSLEKEVLLFIGKGNNGGDAYAAGSELLVNGYRVKAVALFPMDQCSPLSQEQAERFKKAGGEIAPFPIPLPKQGVILDGLLGTGFHGKIEGLLLDAVRAANASSLPILSIDIPSGVNGNTGQVETEAIQATETLYLGLPKLGFFLEQGWEHVGALRYIDFGLSQEAIVQAKAEAHLFHPDFASDLLPKIKRTRHKYQAGYLVAVAGSETMSGAALLSSLAALRTGAGIVRLFHLCETITPPYEIIAESAEQEKVLIELQRARALLIGPGLGRSKEAKRLTQFLLAHSDLPCVIDADALYFLAEHPAWKVYGRSILTPHRKEMERFLNAVPNLTNCQDFVEKRECTLVLKGAPTVIFYPNTTPLIIGRGDPGMATAGTGDVLTGIIGGLLAQGLTPYQAAVTGVFLHALAGESAASDLTSYSLIASDLIQHLPAAIALILP